MAKWGETKRYFNSVVVNYDGDDCLIWPFARNDQGYGHFYLNGKYVYAHRMACESRHGKPPKDRPLAAHSCGNGDLGCCNPKHVRWASYSENAADKILHKTQPRGSQNYNAVLNENQVRLIRLWRPHMTQQKRANVFGVSRELISRIDCGKAWGWLA